MKNFNSNDQNSTEVINIENAKIGKTYLQFELDEDMIWVYEDEFVVAEIYINGKLDSKNALEVDINPKFMTDYNRICEECSDFLSSEWSYEDFVAVEFIHFSGSGDEDYWKRYNG